MGGQCEALGARGLVAPSSSDGGGGEGGGGDGGGGEGGGGDGDAPATMPPRTTLHDESMSRKVLDMSKVGPPKPPCSGALRSSGCLIRGEVTTWANLKGWIPRLPDGLHEL